ncbi:hypothetical protein OHB30_51045 (plasmid) [Streptomyces europaeiscabiei]|nr:hypothetical protein OHB30_51045 [Streptomyces europaeiscabiei]
MSGQEALLSALLRAWPRTLLVVLLKEVGRLSDLAGPISPWEVEPLTRQPLRGEVTVQFAFQPRVGCLALPPHLEWDW